mmetsp:Transcript_2522/g.4943  ORF Transcript_2522/g.4943 Transcript_2522/m.4943 type:complete len:218 (-) Transcript_2522:66-719(-)
MTTNTTPWGKCTVILSPPILRAQALMVTILSVAHTTSLGTKAFRHRVPSSNKQARRPTLGITANSKIPLGRPNQSTRAKPPPRKPQRKPRRLETKQPRMSTTSQLILKPNSLPKILSLKIPRKKKSRRKWRKTKLRPKRSPRQSKLPLMISQISRLHLAIKSRRGKTFLRSSVYILLGKRRHTKISTRSLICRSTQNCYNIHKETDPQHLYHLSKWA